MILVAGATGELGSRIVRRLRAREVPVRALVRPGRDAGALEQLGVSVVRGDLRVPGTLEPACREVDVVVCGVTAISRQLAGEKTSIDTVDRAGTLALVEAAERAGAERFVYVSAAGIDRAPDNPLIRAKRAVESRLASSSLRAVVVRPDAFDEVWLTPLSQLDWERGTLNVLGRGDTPQRYVCVDDVAELVAALALEDDPPDVVEFGGPEALTRNEVCDLIEELVGSPMKRRHVPPAALALFSHVLAPVRPATATLLSLGLAADRNPPSWDDAPLRAHGIEPLPASTYLREHVHSG